MTTTRSASRWRDGPPASRPAVFPFQTTANSRRHASLGHQTERDTAGSVRGVIENACFVGLSRLGGEELVGVGRSGTRPTAFCSVSHDRIPQVLEKFRVSVYESLTLHHAVA